MDDKNWAALKEARRDGTLDEFLDSLGRPAALKAAPAYVEVADRALRNVKAAPKQRGHGERNPAFQPGLFDASGGLEDLMAQLAYLEYRLGDGRVYSHDELLARMDLLAELEAQRRAEAQAEREREDAARARRVEAEKDANILSVVCDRLSRGAA